MVLYICNKCNKHFSRKQSYNIHVNRINPCILDENINKIKELEYNNQLEKTVEELKNTINNFEEKIKLLEEKNIILHTQNNDKDKCLKKKDLEIKK